MKTNQLYYILHTCDKEFNHVVMISQTIMSGDFRCGKHFSLAGSILISLRYCIKKYSSMAEVLFSQNMLAAQRPELQPCFVVAFHFSVYVILSTCIFLKQQQQEKKKLKGGILIIQNCIIVIICKLYINTCIRNWIHIFLAIYFKYCLLTRF